MEEEKFLNERWIEIGKAISIEIDAKVNHANMKANFLNEAMPDRNFIAVSVLIARIAKLKAEFEMLTEALQKRKEQNEKGVFRSFL